MFEEYKFPLNLFLGGMVTYLGAGILEHLSSISRYMGRLVSRSFDVTSIPVCIAVVLMIAGIALGIKTFRDSRKHRTAE